MIALTVRQPFAGRLVDGQKIVENRSRRTELRGRVLIHAGKQPHRLAIPAVREQIRAGRIPTSAIVGFVQLVDSHEAGSAGCSCSPEQGAAFPGDWYGMEGEIWHWVTAGAREFVTPVPAKGALGLWSPTSPTVIHLVQLAIAELGA